jgi:hypothetical protein
MDRSSTVIPPTSIEPPAEPSPTAAAVRWPSEVGELLSRAAAMCAEHGIDLDTFMRIAWNAYVEARPGFREYLEELQLAAQIDQLRRAGKLAEA